MNGESIDGLISAGNVGDIRFLVSRCSNFVVVVW